MKLTSTLIWCSVVAFATATSAQRAYIRNPAPGSTVRKGKKVVLQLVRPNSLQGSREVGIALSFQSCPNGACPDPKNELGTVLYTGQYNPQLHEIPGNPYQNFTITIPAFDFLQPGKAQLVSNRFHLIGVSVISQQEGPAADQSTNAPQAGPSAVLETNTVEVNLTS